MKTRVRAKYARLAFGYRSPGLRAVSSCSQLGQQSFLTCLIPQAVEILIPTADRNMVTAAEKAIVVDTVFDLAGPDASDDAFSPTLDGR
jgi:hypothetical protein